MILVKILWFIIIMLMLAALFVVIFVKVIKKTGENKSITSDVVYDVGKGSKSSTKIKDVWKSICTKVKNINPLTTGQFNVGLLIIIIILLMSSTYTLYISPEVGSDLFVMRFTPDYRSELLQYSKDLFVNKKWVFDYIEFISGAKIFLISVSGLMCIVNLIHNIQLVKIKYSIIKTLNLILYIFLLSFTIFAFFGQTEIKDAVKITVSATTIFVLVFSLIGLFTTIYNSGRLHKFFSKISFYDIVIVLFFTGFFSGSYILGREFFDYIIESEFVVTEVSRFDMLRYVYEGWDEHLGYTLYLVLPYLLMMSVATVYYMIKVYVGRGYTIFELVIAALLFIILVLPTPITIVTMVEDISNITSSTALLNLLRFIVALFIVVTITKIARKKF